MPTSLVQTFNECLLLRGLEAEGFFFFFLNHQRPESQPGFIKKAVNSLLKERLRSSLDMSGVLAQVSAAKKQLPFSLTVKILCTFLPVSENRYQCRSSQRELAKCAGYLQIKHRIRIEKQIALNYCPNLTFCEPVT